jgi:iron complex outermembrane receptor protein
MPPRFRSLIAVTFALTILAAFVIAPRAIAESADSDADAPVWIEEIFVTAEKRRENVLDVPLTMSAFSEQMIEELGMTNIADLEQLVPGLQVGDDHGLSMRGIISQLNREGHTDLAVAVYVNGVYTVDSYGIAPNMFDLERVEVARGPQGTLNGRNSIAGSISYFNKRPTDEWDAEILTEFTDQFTQRYNVAFGGPIDILSKLQGGVLEGAKLSFRITGGYFEGDGAQKNVGPARDYDAPDQYSIAPQLRLQTDRFDLNLRYETTRDTGAPSVQVSLAEPDRTDPDFLNGAFYMYEGVIPSIVNCNTPALSGDPKVTGTVAPCDDPTNAIDTNLDGRLDNETDRFILRADFDITDTLTLSYTYGQTSTRQLETRDFDLTGRVASATDPLIAADAPVPLIDTEFDIPFENDESSHEVLLASNFDGPLNFVAGLFTYENATLWGVGVSGVGFQPPYANVDPDIAAQGAGFESCAAMLEAFGFDTNTASPEHWFCPRPGIDPIGNPFPGFRKFFTFHTAATSNTSAYFASAEYEINDQWRLSGGLRYTADEKKLDASIYEYVLSIIGVPLAIRGSGQTLDAYTWSKTIGNVSLEYSPRDNALIYGRIATGYRAGTLNTEPEVALLKVIGAETLVNYELGVKGLFADDRLVLTAGGFYNDYDDYQYTGTYEPEPGLLSQFSDTPFVESTANIPDTKIWGAEAEATYFINDNWRLSGFYNYLDSKIGAFGAFISGNPQPPTREWTYTDLNTMEMVTVMLADQYDVTGNQLPQQPHHKLSFTVAYNRQLQELGSLQLVSIFTRTGGRWPTLGNIPFNEIPAYSRWDLRANWTSANEQWAVTGYVQNVADKIGLREFLPRSTNGGQPMMGRLTDPRQFGVQVRWRPQF